MLKGSLIEGWYTDLPPPYNRLEIDLRSGYWVKKFLNSLKSEIVEKTKRLTKTASMATYVNLSDMMAKNAHAFPLLLKLITGVSLWERER